MQRSSGVRPTRGAANLHLADRASFLNGTKPDVANLLDVRQTPPLGAAPRGKTPCRAVEARRPLPLAGFPVSGSGSYVASGHRYIASLAP